MRQAVKVCVSFHLTSILGWDGWMDGATENPTNLWMNDAVDIICCCCCCCSLSASLTACILKKKYIKHYVHVRTCIDRIQTYIHTYIYSVQNEYRFFCRSPHVLRVVVVVYFKVFKLFQGYLIISFLMNIVVVVAADFLHCVFFCFVLTFILFTLYFCF